MKYRVLPGIIHTRICGKCYLVTTAETVEISETAYICLKCLEKGADVETLCIALEEQYDIDDKEALLSDVQSLVQHLLSKRLLVRVNN